MGKHGFKIKNYEAASIWEYDHQVRSGYEAKGAMLTNSLFLDFLIDNGLRTWNDKSTRDIIGVSFSHSSRSYTEELKHLQKTIDKYTELGIQDTVDKLNGLVNELDAHPERCIKKSSNELRDWFYVNGIDICYPTVNKRGEVTKTEIIHYKMLYRSTGKAKKGSCMFIRDKLYNKAIDFLRMGIKVDKETAPIVELSAYAPLVSSTIVGRIKINPKNILIIRDIDSYFNTKVVSVETNDKKQCVAKTIDNYQVKNTLFDGQALIDSSIFPDDADGYILLRHHFCKMAAFKTNIQTFFKDYFGEDYSNAKVIDMFGNEHYAKDIELITTDNACKWLKFDISYDYWCDKVYENNCMFGIVKTAHKSKLGDVQRMSYQMVNSLDIEIMPQVVQKSMDYIIKLKTDDDVFLDYLKVMSQKDPFFSDYKVLLSLVEQNRDFMRSEYFRSRRERLIRTYIQNFKCGKIIENADNLVIVGSPYAMLLASVGDDVAKDDTFLVEKGTTQCFTQRFHHDEYLAEFRSPFNSKNNMGYLHNVHHPKMFTYFDLGKQIIAVNMINTDFQDRNNGSDMDSDSIYTTNQKDIVQYAKMCYNKYPTIVNNIPKESKSYENTLINYSNIDNNLAAAQMAIGEASNLAQIALTYSYNFDDNKYIDYVCILSVLAQVAIDNAKRRFDVDLAQEIKRIKKDMNLQEYKYPKFWASVKRDFNKKNINYDLNCPMNYLSNLKIPEFKPKDSTLKMSHFFVKYEVEENRRRCKKVEELIQKHSIDLFNYNTKNDSDDEYDEYLLLQDGFDDLILDIKNIYISNNYVGLFSWLINRAFCITHGAKRNYSVNQSVLENNKALLIKTLYDVNPNNLLKVFSKNA